MRTVSRTLQRLCAFGAGLSMALVFGIIFLNASGRYLFGNSVSWGSELPIYLTIYGVMFGSALAYLTDSHIRFTVLTDLLSEGIRRTLFTVVDVVTFASALALIWSGYAFAASRPQTDASGLTSLADRIAAATGLTWLEWLGRMGPYQAAIAFGGALLAVAAAIRFAERLATVRGDAA